MKIYRTGSVTSAAIPDGTIVNADISATAAIDFSKLASVSATDKILGRASSGAGAIEEIACTSFARSILDDANQAAVQTTLALVPGTNVQAQDAELAAIAGLTSAADSLPYFTGSGTAALATFTAAGRALVDDANVAAQKVTLFGALPTAYTQTYATATRTHSNPVAASVATTGATNVTPYGFTTAAQADAIRAAVNNLITDVANVKQVLNQLIDDLQAAGLIQ